MRVLAFDYRRSRQEDGPPKFLRQQCVVLVASRVFGVALAARCPLGGSVLGGGGVLGGLLLELLRRKDRYGPKATPTQTHRLSNCSTLALRQTGNAARSGRRPCGNGAVNLNPKYFI